MLQPKRWISCIISCIESRPWSARSIGAPTAFNTGEYGSEYCGPTPERRFHPDFTDSDRVRVIHGPALSHPVIRPCCLITEAARDVQTGLGESTDICVQRSVFCSVMIISRYKPNVVGAICRLWPVRDRRSRDHQRHSHRRFLVERPQRLPALHVPNRYSDRCPPGRAKR